MGIPYVWSPEDRKLYEEMFSIYEKLDFSTRDQVAPRYHFFRGLDDQYRPGLSMKQALMEGGFINPDQSLAQGAAEYEDIMLGQEIMGSLG